MAAGRIDLSAREVADWFRGMNFPLRSPSAKIGGIMMLARVIDKIRLAAGDGLPPGYHVGVVDGKRTFDDRLCSFLGVTFDALSERVLEGGTDDEVLEWCFAAGVKPDAEQIEVWNEFLEKRGWRDSASVRLQELKVAAGLGKRDDIQTHFGLIDAEERGQ